MSFALRASMVSACLLLLVYIVYLVNRKRLQLRYSLLWLCMAVVILLCAVFPDPLFDFTRVFGFENASNLIYVAGFLFLLLILLSLSSIVSRQQEVIKNLVQEIALTKHVRGGLASKAQCTGAAEDEKGDSTRGR